MAQTLRAPSEPLPAQAAAVAPPRRRRRARISRAAALTWLAGSLAFVLTASVLRDRAAQVDVLVADRDIAAGVEITEDMLRISQIDADSPLVAGLLDVDGLRPGELAAVPITAGSPLRASDLAAAGRGDGLRSMSIEVERAQAVGGGLSVGDRVDVIDVVDGEATFVVRDAEVTGVPAEPSGRGITGGAGSAYFVVVRVDADEALALAAAIDRGALQVVRATGAAPIEEVDEADDEVVDE